MSLEKDVAEKITLKPGKKIASVAEPVSHAVLVMAHPHGQLPAQNDEPNDRENGPYEWQE